MEPDAGLKPRPLDQAVSSLKQFDKSVGKAIEQIEGKDVQEWIDGLINASGDVGLDPKTVNRKLRRSEPLEVDAIPPNRPRRPQPIQSAYGFKTRRTAGNQRRKCGNASGLRT